MGSSRPPVSTPDPLSIRDALGSSAPLARLRNALRESHERFAVVRPALPASLAAHVQPGPLDAEGWSLLAANAAVAAKLRQLAPRLEDLLQEAGWTARTLRIKVLSAPR